MWSNTFSSDLPLDDPTEFVIAAHHPDRLRRPAVAPAVAWDARREQALLWNVFRTLELLSPPFWLRRLHLRLTGDAALVPPQIARVHLWRHLPLPAIQCIDGARPDALADVMIETEHTVWTLVAEARQGDVTAGDDAARIVDAGRWFAGARQHYCGVIQEFPGEMSPWSAMKARYARSRDSALLQSRTRGPAAPAQVQWGAIGWPHLADLLRDAAGASSLPRIERALASNALDWLTRTGVAEPPALK